ncbi:MAG TPA: MFS transporter [Streptosporangiaceae bacterium]|jgi:EmrB/QacA subfamily drug resistance transporter
MPTLSLPRAVTDHRPRGARRDSKGIALALVLGAQLMIILDMTVVNIALPSIATGLHFSAPGLSWVLNAYTLTFGGLLLLGGRAGDILGRRRVFITGIVVFTLASLAGGLATSSGWLLAARAVQGAGGAIASPAVLALINASFTGQRERTRAIGIFTAVTMGGGSLGLVLGGLITQWVSWRWVLFINVPIGIAVALAAPLVLAESPRQPGRFDIAGALTSTGGMTALVYGFIRAAAAGWGDSLAVLAFTAAVVLLGLFVVTESRARQPITPLRLFTDRGRVAAYVSRLLIIAGMFGMFFFLTQFVQDILGFSPLQAGVSFLPMTLVVLAMSRVAPRLLSWLSPKALMVTGLLPALAGMIWLSRVSPGSAYLTGVLGPMLLIGLGMGATVVPLTIAALAGVRPEDSGAASSMVNVTQQVGGSLGLAILVTAYTSADRDAAAHPAGHLPALAQAHQAVVHGMSSAFTLSAIFYLGALAVILAVIRAPRPAASGYVVTGPAEG